MKDNMNKRNKLKEDLTWLGVYDIQCLRVFRLMYSHDNLDKPINEVVDSIPENKLDWAMQQVENTLVKFNLV